MDKVLPACLASLVLLGGCTLPRRAADTRLFATATPIGFASDIRYYSADWHGLEERSSERLRRVRNASTDGAINVLALSGGGSAGAFGAGALIGLSRRGERPEFQVVTGVSTGALIAPFAFLGPAWDPQLTDAFAGGRSDGFLRARWLTSWFRPGLYDSRPLATVVDRYVTLDLLHAVAREASRGRLLEVATTDLDKEETVVWDMGAIAARGDESARELFRDVLLASASAPGTFRPVLIHVKGGGRAYDEMHVDGATTVPFVGAPESFLFSSLDFASLNGGRIFILVNGSLAAAPQTTQFRTVPVLARSFATAAKHMTRMELASTAGFAQRHGMELQFSALPFDYPQISSLDFSAATMRSLFDYGARCAAQGRLWTTLDQAIARIDVAATQGPQVDRVPAPSRLPECPLDESRPAPRPAVHGNPLARNDPQTSP